MTTRRNISSGTKWERAVGYSRAVRIGPHVWVAGTTAVDERGEVVGRDDPYAQTLYILRKIGRALQDAGADFGDVVRTRIYVVDMRQWEAIGRAHGEVFTNVRPAATMVEVVRLIDTALLVEIEVDAYVEA